MKKTNNLILMLLLTVTLTAQIPDGYYDGTQGLQGEAMKNALHDIIDNHEEYSYNDLRDFILRETDEDPDNPNNVILLYTGRSQPKSTFGGGADDWNREHVWAKSHGDFGNAPPAGTDAHHIRPTDASVNSSRGNLDFDNGGTQHSEATGCYFDNDSWETRDEVKGDVARMVLYMEVRYDGSDGMPNLEVVDEVNTYPAPEHGKLNTLLEWHQQDPPDDFEMNRNEVVFGYQQNRNPFIDHPEFVESIWGNPTQIEQQAAERLKIYPVPAKEWVTIELPAGGKEYRVTIFSAAGNKVKSVQGHSRHMNLDISAIPAGNYVVRVRYGGQTFPGTKFSKN